jgi:hypothetical protein
LEKLEETILVFEEISMEAHKGGKDLESVRGFEVLCGFGF